MVAIQTVSCIHDIPIIRSSTEAIQDVYTKAKEKSAFIRLPCNLAETVADKSIKIATVVATPFSGPAKVFDDYAAQKIKQIEAKYPVINTPTKQVVESLNVKTEPVRQVMNAVKDTTTSTFQLGKERVSNVASVTVNKATDMADTVFTFCETHIPGKPVFQHPVRRKDFGQRLNLLVQRVRDVVMIIIQFLLNSFRLSIHQSTAWLRLLIVFILLKLKNSNESILTKCQQTTSNEINNEMGTNNNQNKLSKLKTGKMSTSLFRKMTKPLSVFTMTIVKHLLVFVNILITKLVSRITPNNKIMAELKKMPRPNPASSSLITARTIVSTSTVTKTAPTTRRKYAEQRPILSGNQLDLNRQNMSNLRKQILAKTLPPIGPRMANTTSGANRLLLNNNKKSSRVYTPIDWHNYFDEKKLIEIDENVFCVYFREKHEEQSEEQQINDDINEECPIFVFLHGKYFTVRNFFLIGLSWAPLSALITGLVRCRCCAIDIRGHGETRTSNDQELQIETLTNDICKVIKKLFGKEDDSIDEEIQSHVPIFLVGHSMGGALAVHVAKKCPSMISALCVIDVVEGSALEALSSMQCFLSSRPKQFNTIEQAIQYMVRSGQVRNVESARVSVVGQIQQVKDIQQLDNNDNITDTQNVQQSPPSHLCSTVAEEDEEDEEEDEGDNQKKSEVIKHSESVPVQSTSTSSPLYTWRIDLSKTEKFWEGWFKGLSNLFLSCNCPKLLLLAGIDRLDRDLTVGQMQGKFQMKLVQQSGHAVHEDAPDKVAHALASFLVRNKLVQPLNEFHTEPPSC
ncbi:unnamed protein product [Didymodactylos carnosus]|uniref:protein phosphatase methylesterase-1 n=1 Tax=Didymodactylos carnosus TaxID=1234261 RepID=A0A813XG07_9BILA|nr:unnamed protein product [Didymodactylos carnosus]CAF0870081.1 unnamed protein product [Didymodactylos carnosus]CAF3606089.1 unnamed protein product [Didymodactylos carnosus]CAF3657420.1 unnamed protein product [Didymodactylos carnosus]